MLDAVRQEPALLLSQPGQLCSKRALKDVDTLATPDYSSNLLLKLISPFQHVTNEFWQWLLMLLHAACDLQLHQQTKLHMQLYKLCLFVQFAGCAVGQTALLLGFADCSHAMSSCSTLDKYWYGCCHVQQSPACGISAVCKYQHWS